MDLFHSYGGSGKGRGDRVPTASRASALGLFWLGLCWGLGASALRLLGFLFSLFRLGFFIPYGCALAHARHAQAHNSGTSGTSDEYGQIRTCRARKSARARYIHRRYVHVLNAPTTSRIEFNLRSVKVLVKAMIDLLRGKKILMRKPHLASR
jgi:hypothetical protein